MKELNASDDGFTPDYSIREMPDSPKILIVDDDQDILFLMKEILKNKYEFKGTNSPIRAKQLVETEPFDILITDTVLPDQVISYDKFLPYTKVRSSALPGDRCR